MSKLRPWEGAQSRRNPGGGYGSGFRDSVPIQGITLEEGGCSRTGLESVSVCKRLLCMFTEGWSLAFRDWALVAPRGQLGRVSEGKCLVRVAS